MKKLMEDQSMEGYCTKCIICCENCPRNTTLCLHYSFTFLYGSDGFPNVLTKTIPTSTFFFQCCGYCLLSPDRLRCDGTLWKNSVGKIVVLKVKMLFYFVGVWLAIHPPLLWKSCFVFLRSRAESSPLERMQQMKCRPGPMTLTKPCFYQLRYLLQSLLCYCVVTDNIEWKLGK